jgi:hypothetical protein
LQGETYAIRIGSGSTLILADTCFVNNNFVGEGTVVVVDKGAYIGSGNYGTMDDGLTCQFVNLNGTCVEYDSKTCVPDPSLTGSESPSPSGTSGSSSLQLCWSVIWMVVAIFYLVP